MKRFSEFLREANISAISYKIPTIGSENSPEQESEQEREKSLDKVVKEFKKGIDKPNYSSVKKMIQGNEKLSTGAIDLDMTPKPKASAAPVPMAEPQEGT